MNAFAPQVAPQGRYDTKATCRELGISRSTLTRYTKAGLIRPRTVLYRCGDNKAMDYVSMTDQ